MLPSNKRHAPPPNKQCTREDFESNNATAFKQGNAVYMSSFSKCEALVGVCFTTIATVFNGMMICIAQCCDYQLWYIVGVWMMKLILTMLTSSTRWLKVHSLLCSSWRTDPPYVLLRISDNLHTNSGYVMCACCYSSIHVGWLAHWSIWSLVCYCIVMGWYWLQCIQH